MGLFDHLDDFGYAPRPPRARKPIKCTGMPCPECHHPGSGVSDSRVAPEGYVRRRRTCSKCQHRWTTYETMTAPDERDILPIDKQRIVRLNEISDALRRSLKL